MLQRSSKDKHLPLLFLLLLLLFSSFGSLLVCSASSVNAEEEGRETQKQSVIVATKVDQPIVMIHEGTSFTTQPAVAGDNSQDIKVKDVEKDKEPIKANDQSEIVVDGINAEPTPQLPKTNNSGTSESTNRTEESPVKEESSKPITPIISTNNSTANQNAPENGNESKSTDGASNSDVSESEQRSSPSESKGSSLSNLPAVPLDKSDISTNEPQQQQQNITRPLEPKTDVSSGIIALLMAIAFAVVVIIVYFGLLGWRRYLEYRYGNRELLVNDLEFDTNDLRHFEL